MKLKIVLHVPGNPFSTEYGATIKGPITLKKINMIVEACTQEEARLTGMPAEKFKSTVSW